MDIVTNPTYYSFPIIEFLRTNKIPNMSRVEMEFSVKDALDRILILLRDSFQEIQIDVSTDLYIYVFGSIKETPIAIRLYGSKVTSGISSVAIVLYGSDSCISEIKEKLTQAFGEESSQPIRWWYLSPKGEPLTNSVFLPPSKDTICSELYPDITPNPETFIENYLNSEATILLLAGPPGTGKTSLLRHMVQKHHLECHVVYDESLMNNDSLFQSFLSGQGTLMIIEDADTILSPRDLDHNKLMSRFLNVSDGLIKFPKKKLVFSTNITDFSRIDAAITRPGRCFGIVHTRPLNLAEAQVVAKKYSLPVPLTKQEYTLAELFNSKRDNSYRKMGFV